MSCRQPRISKRARELTEVFEASDGIYVRFGPKADLIGPLPMHKKGSEADIIA